MSSLLRLERQIKDFLKSTSNSFITLSQYSFGAETTIVHTLPVVPSKTISASRPKWAKHRFSDLKWRKNHALRGGTYLYDLYRRVSSFRPPPPRPQLRVADMPTW